MRSRIDLLFERLVVRSVNATAADSNDILSSESLVAVYEAPNLANGLSKSVVTSLYEMGSKAFWEAAASHPGRSISMPPVLDERIDVVFHPKSEARVAKPLYLELREGSAVIRADCEKEVYDHFKAITKGKPIVAGDFRHHVRLTLGRAIRLKDDCGFMFRIENIQVRIEPTSSPDALRVMLLEQEPAESLFGATYDSSTSPGVTAQRQDREKSITNLLDNL